MRGALSWACIAFTFRAATAEPLVSLAGSKVTYQGSVSDSVEQFQNIRFAHDTSGQRRFAPPEPFTPSPDTIVDATTAGPACPQLQNDMPPFFTAEKVISEDCLNLRIARPAGVTAGSRLPVVVWLHGGGVVTGSAYDPHFDPEPLVKLSVSEGRPVIYASLNYRLSIFGFARLPLLKDRKSLNVGMRDQRAGFQWIKDNIEEFGGDPEKITAFGLSAGGTFISIHPMAYGGEQGVPFQQAWMMSGPPGTAVNMSSEATTQHTLAVASNLGCGSDSSDTETLAFLRDVPMQDLINTAMDYSIANHPPAGIFTFIPSLDDDFMPDRQSNLMEAGKFVKGIPMIFGWTQDDGAMNAGPAHLIQSEDDMLASIKSFAHALSEEQLSSLFTLYPASAFAEDLGNYNARKDDGEPEVPIHWFRLSQILRDLLFTCPSIEFGYHMTKHTRASGNALFDGVRLYDLNQSALTPMWKGAGMPYVKVSHGSDTNYIFNGVFPEGTLIKEDQELSESVTRNLINFAYTGDPTSGASSQQTSVDWPGSFVHINEKSYSALSNLNIQVIGGPHGTGSAVLRASAVKGDTELGQMQQVLSDEANYQEMGSQASQERAREITRENLFERCAFVSSLAESLGL